MMYLKSFSYQKNILILLYMVDFTKLKYWYDKSPELPLNIEPLTQLMIRTAGESNNYIKHHSHSK